MAASIGVRYPNDRCGRSRLYTSRYQSITTCPTFGRSFMTCFLSPDLNSSPLPAEKVRSQEGLGVYPPKASACSADRAGGAPQANTRGFFLLVFSLRLAWQKSGQHAEKVRSQEGLGLCPPKAFRPHAQIPEEPGHTVFEHCHCLCRHFQIHRKIVLTDLRPPV